MPMVGAAEGGNLIVNPPRVVWERRELTPEELTQWSFLVAATGSAMLDALPQLKDGCINYWEAGNWALNEAAEPRGPKTPRIHRRLHHHLLGRSRTAPRWGEAPHFPDFADRLTWAKDRAPLSADECAAVVARTRVLLRERYGVTEGR
jgi:hypothetical protein